MSVMTRLDDKEDITQHEISALKTRFNLADAHTHQDQSVTQREIVNRLPELWYRAQGQSQYQSEQEFIQAFFTFHGQEHALKRHDEIYLVYAASIAMHITATYLRKRNMRVGLIEPCFDNLHDLLKHMEVPLTPLDETLLQSPTNVYAKLQSAAANVDAIFLVDPNNPTGTSMFAKGADTFVEVARYCKDHGKLLILDFCFAAFFKAAGGSRVDAYAILDDIGTQYIIMEDTGKTWPLQDTKCATIMASRAINPDIYSIVTSVLLNVSPFILNVVTQYIRDSSDDDFESVRSVLDVNRAVARRHLQGSFLNYLTPMVETSVAWFEILRDDVSADDLQAYLMAYEVYVLPGKYFYWSQPQAGQKYIRLALARKPEEFEQAVETIALALENYHG
ncbi:aminotransferase class I/II-fold pyridoxal phosphate-dependent enzyme [Pseudomonas sp. SWRI92]|uniref:cysteine-S-conjugate beta-lyase n=1 Tax=Pseudomonas marvdashtae TaxID=2745500 RepID=A0A923FQS1_9PSED|nr:MULTISPECIES: aminotransferase class I/II-fold pyridoxal phosphate-dependent enzyme [Pseudomonas]MBC3373685.1 aminotransferase class I/II-fold pyridoxal phosphate-dependent enzyme [Pseudomonas sp. SWRI92]MBV4553774.1 aminotransferase class I/II-fold pyridoxal phosphate-dependent enzyme [Pseudomonas marvdashtae]